MKLFGTSALKYWRLAAYVAGGSVAFSSPRRYANELCSLARESFQSGLSLQSDPELASAPFDMFSLAELCRAADGLVHLETDQASSRYVKGEEIESYVSHLRTDEAFSSCWLSAGFGIKVPTPELCLLQLAGQLSLPALIAAEMEICGSYGVAPTKEETLFKRGPLSTPSLLGALLERNPSAYGAKRFRRSLAYALPDSASPQETRLYLLLCLPVRMGGYGLPKARVNYRVETNGAGGIDPARRYRVCDLYWPKHQVAVEYDSNAFHSGAESISSDSIRRASLSTRGISVVTATQAQLASMMMADHLAAALCRELGIRKRPCVHDWTRERRELRRALFGKLL